MKNNSRTLLSRTTLDLFVEFRSPFFVALNERFFPFSSGRRLITTPTWKRSIEDFRTLAAGAVLAAGRELAADSEFRLRLRQPERFDVDALSTFVLNGLQGAAYKNDRQVRALRVLSEPRDDIGVELFRIGRSFA